MELFGLLLRDSALTGSPETGTVPVTGILASEGDRSDDSSDSASADCDGTVVVRVSVSIYQPEHCLDGTYDATAREV